MNTVLTKFLLLGFYHREGVSRHVVFKSGKPTTNSYKLCRYPLANKGFIKSSENGLYNYKLGFKILEKRVMEEIHYPEIKIKYKKLPY